jgi:hypothetical protein
MRRHLRRTSRCSLPEQRYKAALAGAASPLAERWEPAAVARARAVTAVRLSAQPPADRSGRRLIPRRRRTAPANRWAARRLLPAPRRLGNALEPLLRLTSPSHPPRGTAGRHRRRCALPVPSLPFAPTPPPEGSAARFAPGCKRLCRSCLLREAALPSRLGLPPHGGGHAQQRAGLLGLHLSLACLSSLRARLAMYYRSAPASRPGPHRGWGCA